MVCRELVSNLFWGGGGGSYQAVKLQMNLDVPFLNFAACKSQSQDIQIIMLTSLCCSTDSPVLKYNSCVMNSGLVFSTFHVNIQCVSQKMDVSELSVSLVKKTFR